MAWRRAWACSGFAPAALLALACIGGVARPCCVEQVFRKAVLAPPEEYLPLHGQLVACDGPALRYLKTVEETGETWLVRTLAAALAQRIEQPEMAHGLDEEFAQFSSRGIPWWDASGLEPWRQSRLAKAGPRMVPFLVEMLFKEPARRVADPTVKGFHMSAPQGTALALLQTIGGDTAARAIAVHVMCDTEPTAVAKAACLTDAELATAMIAALCDEKKMPVAAWALGEFRDARAVGPLAATLTDYCVGRYLFAAEALAKIGEPALPALAAALRSPTRPTQSWAEHALAKMGKIAIPTLQEAVETDGDIPHCQYHAVRALRRIGGGDAVPPLIEALRSPDSEARAEAARALGEIGDARARAPLLQALAKPENHEEIALFGIAEALGKFKETRALGTLMSWARISDDWLIRRAAIEGLGLMGDRRAVAALIQCAQHADFHTRGDAAVALGQIGDRAAIPSLLKGLEDKEAYVRSWSAWALRQIESQEGPS